MTPVVTPDARAAATEAGRRRPADGDGRVRGDAAPEVARAADLRLGPALVGRLRDGGGARRPGRRLGGRGAPGLPAFARRSRRCWRSSSSPTARRFASTRRSGGAYVVAKENLGRLPSLVAAAALLTDYILTVAVSVAAGVLALTSAATSLRGHELDALDRVRAADRGRESARRAGGRDPVRDSDLCVRDVDLRADHRRLRASARPVRARPRSCRTRRPPASGPSRRSSFCAPSRRARRR